ncbi:MAG: hypothetical protein HYZ09_02270, partial [Candidatus Kerfeldbacteria bacterium]|nr:hypothetical protein [Candidatus Kerfeldbacteria bacterium]
MYQLHNVLTPQPRTRPAIWRFSNAVTALAVLAQIAIPGLLFGVPSPARALESGFQNPTTNASHGGSSSAVFAPENAYALDNVDALFDDADHHLYGGFGLAIPAGSVATGIEVAITARCLSNCDEQPLDKDFRVYLTDNGGSSWGASVPTSDFGPSYATVTLGGQADRWGREIWDAAELSDANFLVRLSNDFHDPITPPLQEPIRGVIGVDHVQVRVHYSTPNPAVGVSCGLDIALVVDSSGSIEEDELFLMQNAFEGFVDAFLPGTPSLMSVT